MLIKTRFAMLALSLFITSGAIAANQPEEGHIPISGIFVADAMETVDDVADGRGYKSQSFALSGLLVGVLIVIGTGRAYSQLHSRISAELATVQTQRKAIIQDSVRIYDSEVVETLTECEILEQEISDLKYELNQIQQGI